jgi:hypothetical protein
LYDDEEGELLDEEFEYDDDDNENPRRDENNYDGNSNLNKG